MTSAGDIGRWRGSDPGSTLGESHRDMGTTHDDIGPRLRQRACARASSRRWSAHPSGAAPSGRRARPACKSFSSSRAGTIHTGGNRRTGLSALPHRILIAVLVLLPGVTSCGDDPAVEPTPDPPSPAVLVVTPETVLFTALGDTLRLAAEVRDQQGRPMSGAAVAWTSSNASVAAVAQSAVVRAVAPGAATITATSGTVSGVARITVRQDVASVGVSPRVASLVMGDTVCLTAEARDANGNAVPGTAFVWRTSNEQVAGVDSTGLVRAHGRGEATIGAASAGSDRKRHRVRRSAQFAPQLRGGRRHFARPAVRGPPCGALRPFSPRRRVRGLQC